SRAAISSFACCSSSSLYSTARPQAASTRQASTATSSARQAPRPRRPRVPAMARRSLNTSIRTSPERPFDRNRSGLLAEQLLDAVGRAVGHVRGQLALEQELVAGHRQLDDLAG